MAETTTLPNPPRKLSSELFRLEVSIDRGPWIPASDVQDQRGARRYRWVISPLLLKSSRLGRFFEWFCSTVTDETTGEHLSVFEGRRHPLLRPRQFCLYVLFAIAFAVATYASVPLFGDAALNHLTDLGAHGFQEAAAQTERIEEPARKLRADLAILRDIGPVVFLFLFAMTAVGFVWVRLLYSVPDEFLRRAPSFLIRPFGRFKNGVFRLHFWAAPYAVLANLWVGGWKLLLQEATRRRRPKSEDEALKKAVESPREFVSMDVQSSQQGDTPPSAFVFQDEACLSSKTHYLPVFVRHTSLNAESAHVV